MRYNLGVASVIIIIVAIKRPSYSDLVGRQTDE